MTFMQEQTWQPPNWWYQEKRPTTDEAYFENMSRVIFQAGLNWRVIDQKWHTLKTAFSNFKIEKVACFTRQRIRCNKKTMRLVPKIPRQP